MIADEEEKKMDLSAMARKRKQLVNSENNERPHEIKKVNICACKESFLFSCFS
jgi:hypothetical protein